MGPGEEEDFRLVTVDGDTTVRGTDQDKGVVFILREKRGRGGEKTLLYQPTPRERRQFSNENSGKSERVRKREGVCVCVCVGGGDG